MNSDRTPDGAYTFGDNALAAERLCHLSRVFEPSLQDLLRRHARDTAGHVLDFGCGPGFTTRALWAALEPEALTGIDSSAAFLEQARRESPVEVSYVLADVTALPGGLPQADLGYSRFLLTHLAAPGAALAGWAEVLRPGARLLLQETAELDSDQPDLARYYELVAEFQRRHGQRLNIGRDLLTLVDERLYHVIDYTVLPLTLSMQGMARLHAMNLTTWRHDAMAHSFGEQELQRLAQSLDELSRDEQSLARVRHSMGELVLERRG
jgi:trans-aconitate 2-methyltransferase